MSNLKCHICDRDCKSFVSLGTHIYKAHHINRQYYYDKYLKKEYVKNKQHFKI